MVLSVGGCYLLGDDVNKRPNCSAASSPRGLGGAP